MEWEHTLVTIASILIPMMAGFAWVISRMDKKFEHTESKLSAIENRLSRLEGRLEERGYWEARRNGTQEKG